jgi:hypothetical protein
MLAAVSLEDDLRRAAAAAAAFADKSETLAGIVPAEPSPGRRLYLCAYRSSGGETSWLVFDEAGTPVLERSLVRETASITALCELASEGAGGGDLDALRERLAELRETENPLGIDEAEEAAAALEAVVGSPPFLATPQRLDAIGAATRRLEAALGGGPDSPFTQMMRDFSESVQTFTADVEAAYKGALT